MTATRPQAPARNITCSRHPDWRPFGPTAVTIANAGGAVALARKGLSIPVVLTTLGTPPRWAQQVIPEERSLRCPCANVEMSAPNKAAEGQQEYCGRLERQVMKTNPTLASAGAYLPDECPRRQRVQLDAALEEERSSPAPS